MLGPTLFLIFINDLDVAVEITGALVKKFADDTKCYMVVKSEQDKVRFQTMLQKLETWGTEWQMLFNMDKCHVIHAGKHNPQFEYVWGGRDLVVTEAEKDVGVMVTSNLKPSLQCANAAKKANMVLGQIARGVTYRDRITFIKLYQVFVLPHLSYAVQAWAPFYKADKELLEKVQRRAVMMVTNIRGTYEERLASLKMRTLEDRRIRGDLIETFKIITGKSNVVPETWFTFASSNTTDDSVRTRATTGYLNLVQPPIPKTEIRKNFFSNRVVDHWNQLPDHVKMSQKTNDFKNALDRHCGY